MKPSDLPKLFLAAYRASKAVVIKGSPGHGKTSIMVDALPMLRRETGKHLGLVIINGGCFTITDATGYLVPREVDGRMMSEFTKPFWWITEDGKPLDDYEGGIILVDEGDKLGVDEKKIMGEGMLSGRLASHRLPPGWVIWMTANRAEDRSGSTKELDHLINRRIEIDMTPDLSSWEAWAVTHGVHPLVTAFAVQHPHIVFEGKVPEKQGPFCTPRSLVETMKLLLELSPDGEQLPTDPFAVEVAAGGVGQSAAAQLFSYIRLGLEMPTFEEIVKDPGGVRMPEKPDGQMLVTYNLAARVDKNNIAPVVEYVSRFPKEFAVTFAKAAVRRDAQLVTSKPMLDWCQKNTSLMSALRDVK